MQPSVHLSGPSGACENFLYGFKGACGASRAGSPPRRAQARRHPRAGPARQSRRHGCGS